MLGVAIVMDAVCAVEARTADWLVEALLMNAVVALIPAVTEASFSAVPSTALRTPRAALR